MMHLYLFLGYPSILVYIPAKPWLLTLILKVI
jgi:hypothetical protein